MCEIVQLKTQGLILGVEPTGHERFNFGANSNI